MKKIMKGVLAIACILIGIFYLLIGQIRGEGTTGPSAVWYVLLVFFFGTSVILVVTMFDFKRKK